MLEPIINTLNTGASHLQGLASDLRGLAESLSAGDLTPKCAADYLKRHAQRADRRASELTAAADYLSLQGPLPAQLPTPIHTPWKWEPQSRTFRTSPGNHWIGTLNSWDGHVTPHAHATGAFIVRAVNNHAALVAALESLLDACELWEDQNDPVLSEGRQAIAKARGEA